ncbi:protein of unknown function [Denitratisoma oestradiolicum]|uniref:Uncharacterized protein n=1 Tax=Denitratisoma oestradiolicum TaxID=311182 RepID=A0A6S6XS27_9PROT|nr:protein of unknown function [Denitratisoma oestradiolicum]
MCRTQITLQDFGGGRRDRTDDPLLAKQVLSQLSYAPQVPITFASRRCSSTCIDPLCGVLSRLDLLGSRTLLDLVGLVGFEPTTPALSRRCSNQLSYRPTSVPLNNR